MTTDTTRAFDGLAETYARHRPDYPAPLFERLVALCPTERAITALDVGAGTGISSRALARAFAAARPGGDWRILAVEPGEDMRRQAEAGTPADLPITYLALPAERLEVADGTIDLVLTAQAVHWFDRPVFYREAGRVLAPGGHLVIANNNRQIEGDPFMADYEAFLETYSPRYGRRYRDIDFTAELGALAWADPPQTWDHAWHRTMTREAFIGMACSSSKTKAAVEAHGWPVIEAALKTLTERHADDGGRLDVPYVSVLDFARKTG